MGYCEMKEGECRLQAALAALQAPRRLRWVVGELHTATERLPDPPQTCTDWLVEPHLSRYLAAAEAGHLRRRTTPNTQSSPATTRARATGLRTLARHLGLPLPVATGSAPPPAPGAAPRDVARFLTHLSHDTRPLGIRTWAVAALAATGIGVADLADLRLTDIHTDTLTRNWNRRGPGDPVAGTRKLPGWAEAPLAEWLETRHRVVASDRVPHVFVTCHPSHRGPSVYAAGLPVSARGLTRAHSRAVDDYFAALFARVGEDRAREIARRLRLGELAM